MWLALAPSLSKRCCTCHNVGAGPSIMMKLSLMMSTKEITAMKRLDFAQVVPDAASAMMALEKYVRSSGIEPA